MLALLIPVLSGIIVWILVSIFESIVEKEEFGISYDRRDSTDPFDQVHEIFVIMENIGKKHLKGISMKIIVSGTLHSFTKKNIIEVTLDSKGSCKNGSPHIYPARDIHDRSRIRGTSLGEIHYEYHCSIMNPGEIYYFNFIYFYGTEIRDCVYFPLSVGFSIKAEGLTDEGGALFQDVSIRTCH